MVPAPETAHAIRAAIQEAEKCKQTGQEKCIVFNYSGHGFFDLTSYQQYFEGKLEEYEYPEEEIRRSIAKLPEVG
jgi:tryptophan synthase beta chain